MSDGALLFYSAWPRGFHNIEAERKADAFAAAGHDVVYVAGVGTKNPGIASAGKVVDRVGRAVAGGSRGGGGGASSGVRDASVLVVPPRQVERVRRLNERLLVHQLRRVISDWSDATAWVRWPTPELTGALRKLAPRAVVYECVDAYHLTPGIRGSWRRLHDEAERELVDLADAVVVPGEVLAERFRPWGADVRVVPHGVDPFAWRPRANGSTVIGFVGTLDYRIDTEVFRALAGAHADWRIRFIGPQQEGFDPAAYEDLPNVQVEPPVPQESLPDVLAEIDVGLLAYVDSPLVRAMTPVKSLELLAAGRPVVARRSPALERFGEVIDFADTPAEFVATVERALREDLSERAAERRAVAEGNSWDRRLGELVSLVQELRR